MPASLFEVGGIAFPQVELGLAGQRCLVHLNALVAFT
jgi:hypothetical protein